MANTLFGAKLDLLHPGNLLRTEARPHLVARQLADAQAELPPTNEQILEAVKGVYHAHSDTVDANTLSGLQYAKSTDGHPRVAALNAYNWKSGQAAPIRPTAEQVYTAPLMKSGVQAATTNPDIWTLVIGVSESAQFFIGEEGGVGVGFLLARQADVKVNAYLAGKLGLDIDVAFNLQLGLWNATPEDLAGDFYGLEVNLDLEVGVSLGVFLRRNLSFYGFSVGVGVGVGGGATVIAGYTWVT
jgi:hypothetical protein